MSHRASLENPSYYRSNAPAFDLSDPIYNRHKTLSYHHENDTAIGQFNRLIVTQRKDFGVILDGRNLGNLLLPNRYVPEDTQLGDEVDVFIYADSEDQLIATTQSPKALVGQVAFLETVSVDYYGAFMDWGLMKDLLVPFNEQICEMSVGRRYLVYVYIEPDTHRIAGSAKINQFLDLTPANYEENEAVDLIIYEESELGYKAIINHQHIGLLYRNEVFRELTRGQTVKGYIKKQREDGKVDLSLRKPGYQGTDALAAKILKRIEKADGFLPITDKSAPEIIYDTFGVSKKRYKMAVGSLYKQRLVILEKEGIRRA